MKPLRIDGRLSIPAQDLSYEYARSGGPGGQHVNKTETLVRLRLDLDGCRVLEPPVKRRLRKRWPGHVTKDGEFLVTSDETRSRKRNTKDARERMASMIRRALQPPKRRRPTRPTRASKRRRIRAKRHRGEIKSLRGKVGRDDW
ncbi:MAG: alternative ribosome rescue aminoacyl-tRNA hydrolase ArfB [Myxococcota bacterium]